MARLTKAHKVFIVRSLARYSSHNEAMSAFKEYFGISVSKQQVALYHPENKSCTVGKEMRELFYRERDAFLNDTEGLPYTYRGFRIKKLCEAAEIAEEQAIKSREPNDVRAWADCIMKIDKLMNVGQKDNEGEDDPEEIRPTLQQINNYIYFDK